MLHNGRRTKGGTMSLELQEQVDVLLDEFVAIVDSISQERHLQKGIARSSLPCSMVAVVDKKHLLILGQFKSENLSSMYLHLPEIELAADKALSAARWEFGFEDPFIIQFPFRLLDQSEADRHRELEKIASEHVDSEFIRFMELLSMLRTRPIFGMAPFVPDSHSALVILPQGEVFDKVYETASKSLDSFKLIPRRSGRIWTTKAAVRAMWISVCEARIVIADLSGSDPEVMYALGIAHAVGKESILLYPQDSTPPLDLPHTRSIGYQAEEDGLNQLELKLTETLRAALEPLVS